MKRLTKRWGEEPYPNLAGKVVCEYKECDSTRSCEDCIHGQYKDRLAAIEDILGDEYDLERVRELVEADRDGRCIISPCKTGDTVYFKTFTNNARKCLGICPHVVTAIKAHAEVKGEFHNVELPLSQFGDTWDLREEALKAREQDGNNK